MTEFFFLYQIEVAAREQSNFKILKKSVYLLVKNSFFILDIN